jgi:Glucodextranase, domain B/PASTA domain
VTEKSHVKPVSSLGGVRGLLLLAIPLAAAACGATPRPASDPRVTLQLSAPGDGRPVRAKSVEVRGTVSPSGASVQVNGESAQVSGGEFAADVALAPGANVIDVTASAPGRRADADALRVTRDVRVKVPELVGTARADALDRLDRLGLRPREQRGGGFLDDIVPAALQVCLTDPPAGELVDPGTAVTVVVARNCP